VDVSAMGTVAHKESEGGDDNIWIDVSLDYK